MSYIGRRWEHVVGSRTYVGDNGGKGGWLWRSRTEPPGTRGRTQRCRRMQSRWWSLTALYRPRGSKGSRTRFCEKWIKVNCSGRQTDYCLIFPLVYISCKFNMICIGGGPLAWQGALIFFDKVVTAAINDRQMRISRSWLPTRDSKRSRRISRPLDCPFGRNT